MSAADEAVPARARLLGLEPHPEGGWYRRTWTAGHSVAVVEADGSVGSRAAATLIHFLLPPGEFSAWHVVAFDEVWLWHGPDSLVLQLGGSGEAPVPAETVVLGGMLEQGERAQVVIPPVCGSGHCRQRAKLSSAAWFPPVSPSTIGRCLSDNAATIE